MAAMDRVAKAMVTVPRTGFLPEAQRRHARYDGPLEIGHGQTNSQPRTVADMLRLLDVQPGHTVLDVGAGSGWTTALLWDLVGDPGCVLGVELEPELVTFGSANLARLGLPPLRQALPGVLGLPDEGPFDRVLVSAEPPELPEQLVAQLAEDGVMVIPVAGTMLRVVRTGEAVRTTRHGSYRFVPLR